MFSEQKKRLAQAERAYNEALIKKNVTRKRLRQHCHLFLGEPLNLLYPFSAGALVCASQLKNEAKGIQRIPFLNLAKMAVGIWATTKRIRRVNNSE